MLMDLAKLELNFRSTSPGTDQLNRRCLKHPLARCCLELTFVLQHAFCSVSSAEMT